MKKVGLALGGGTALGLAHIGVIEILEKNKIPIDYISGTSSGAIIGALYASGMNISDIKKIAETTKWENLVDFKIPIKGILSGDRLEKFIRVLLKNKTFEELDIPLAVIATDIYNGEKVTFRKGDVASAIRASISIPSIFVPFRYQNRVLVDGGVVDPVPVEILKKMGADITIAVDLSKPIKNISIKSTSGKSKRFMKKIEKKMIEQELDEINKYASNHKASIPWFLQSILNHPQKIFDYLLKKRLKTPKLLTITSNSFEIMVNALSKYALLNADYVINPTLNKFNRFDFDKSKEIINSGKKATTRSIKDIKKLIK
ncbi:hypothetical protein HOD61_02280 [archaeon]|jgi:NTE family protein|nr:hypothetical protein [archaeon]